MINYWKLQGIPHKGWILEDVIDSREYQQEVDYENCMMCGNEKIRYIHILTHPDIEEEYRVGCMCAEKMTNDYVNPKQREIKLKNKANRRIKWSQKKWKISQNGNSYLNFQEHHILIYVNKETGKFKVKIGEIFGKKEFDNLDEAKIAAFDGIEYLKESGDWWLI